MAKKKPKALDNTIVLNKKARHDYFLQDTFEAGVVLEGWEVKSLRLKKVQLIDSYVLIKDGEAFLLGCNVTPLNTASTHVIADPSRTKKLLLHSKELAKLFIAVQQKGNTVCRSEALLERSPHQVSDSIRRRVSKTMTSERPRKIANGR
jgi:SsrA-binding protein